MESLINKNPTNNSAGFDPCTELATCTRERGRGYEDVFVEEITHNRQRGTFQVVHNHFRCCPATLNPWSRLLSITYTGFFSALPHMLPFLHTQCKNALAISVFSLKIRTPNTHMHHSSYGYTSANWAFHCYWMRIKSSDTT